MPMRCQPLIGYLLPNTLVSAYFTLRRLRRRKGENPFPRNTLHSAGACAALLGDFQHTHTGPQLPLDARFQFG
jgi:hypothetical protein